MSWHVGPLHGFLSSSKRTDKLPISLRPVPHRWNTVRRGTVIEETCAGILEEAVFTTEGTRLPFDYLVLAPGRMPTIPTREANPRRWYSLAAEGKERRHLRRALRQTKSLIVAGGGLGGIEFAIAFKRSYPTAKCTLVSRSKVLLPVQQKAAHRVCDVNFSGGVKVLESINSGDLTQSTCSSKMAS